MIGCHQISHRVRVNTIIKEVIVICECSSICSNTSRQCLRQGDPISPNTFILVLERILDKIRDKEGGVKISGTRINNLAFADDIDLIEEDALRLEETTRALN